MQPAPETGAGPRRASWWSRFEAGPLLTVSSALFLASALVMLFEGFSRSLAGVSYFWAEEAVRFLMIWAFFLTLGLAGRRGLHIRTELLVDAMPPRVRRAMHLVALVAGLAFAAVLFGASVPQLLRYHSMGMMSESSLDIPQWVVFLAMPIGAAAWFGYYAQCLVVWARGGDAFAAAPPDASSGAQV